ncbi:MAG: hypothetical protein AAF074_16075 [Pseudomonadota bacterium]
MQSFLLVLLGLVLGGFIGFFGGGAIGLGAGAGVGIATGLQAGACLTLEAAREQDLITAEQEPGILAAAATAFASEELPEGPDTSKIDCAKVVADLRKATAEAAAD